MAGSEGSPQIDGQGAVCSRERKELVQRPKGRSQQV